MLSVTFTGNVATDFPATQTPGVVILPDNANVQHPVIGDPALANLVGVSGFDINSLRVSYSPENNGTLFLGIEQPANPNDPLGRPVIASDADNNGNSGTVNPAVSALGLGVQDPADFGGTEFMGVYLDFLGTGTGQIVAGFSQNVPAGGAAKVFQVATASQAGPNVAPTFVTPLPQFQGNIYTQNDPNHPNMELSIVNFDTLYQQVTGSPIAPTAVFNVGAFAGSAQDGPISEAFFPAQPVLLSAATPVPEVCPPISPPILINPHEHRIIDNAHGDLVRVYVQGTSGFDPSTIDPATVELNGASPVATKPYQFPRSPFPSQMFAFRASDIDAEPGLQTLTFRAKTFDGQEVISSNVVVNVPNSAQASGRLKFLMNRTGQSQYNSLRRLAASNPDAILDPSILGGAPTSGLAASVAPARVNLGPATAAAASVIVNYSPSAVQGPVDLPRQVVSIPTAQSGSKLPSRLNRSMADYLDQVDAPVEDHDLVLSGAH
ncbi:hypothetical protein [Paludisphaera soli]|uniref:hypothetical protein n=1 Tax=Paludisphaera soli TaxID=2712865 RepID=UPI0013EA1A86|nr:hypothetical protein [Paludisphaera soli]